MRDNGSTEKATFKPTVSRPSLIYLPQTATISRSHCFRCVPLVQGNQWTRYPTNGHGRKSTWIAVNRLRCTVRRFVDQRSYSATQSAVRAGVDKTTSRCQGDGTYYPNGRLLCGRRKNICPADKQTKYLRETYNLHCNPFTSQKLKYCIRFVNRYCTVCPGTVMDFRPP